jgi:hypothetical protein
MSAPATGKSGYLRKAIERLKGPTCLRCGHYYQPDAQKRLPEDCRCTRPVPSDDGKTPIGAPPGTDFREIELMHFTGGVHAAWCPSGSSLAYGCYCRYGRLELSDPRPELVQEAVERHRAKERTHG